MAEHESADEFVAAELATLLPRLPRVKITPQTITQTIIDRWYDYETDYRQTIAELRAELAAAREHAQTAHDQTAELGGHVVQLRTKLAESHDALTVAAELIDRLTDDGTCDYDHHDNCRTHSLQKRPCPHPLGRQFVEAWRAVEAERKEAADDDHQ